MLRVFDPHQLKDLMCKKVSAEEQVLESVKQILADVRLRGLEAVIEYTKKYDGVLFEDSQIIVSQDEFDRAYACVEKDFLISLKKAMQRIIYFHQKQKRVSWLERDEDGNLLGQINNPISRVGVYVPGGTAAYPSSVLMNVIPAKVAGVSEIIMVTPADANGSVNAHTLVAAKEAGVDLIYKVGGAQAIAWLAYGGEGFESVDIITGPGNAYVAQAKRLVYGAVGIDMIAGPSEILIIADATADPSYIAADLLSQAEHDSMASAVLVSPNLGLIEEVKLELTRQLVKLPRKIIAQKALEDYGAAVKVTNLEEAVAVSNAFAPEHLELMVNDPLELLGKIRNAGAIFLGSHSPEAVGDYLAGSNHILPTGATARFFSPVSVDTFTKWSNVIYYKKDNLVRHGKDIINLAEVEGLDAHANSIKVRLGT